MIKKKRCLSVLKFSLISPLYRTPVSHLHMWINTASFYEFTLHTGLLKMQLVPLGERKSVIFNQDCIAAQHLFKISPNCNEVQLSVPNTGGLTQHTNSSCGKGVGMTHVGTLCVSVGDERVRGWSTVNVSWSWRDFH